MGPETPTLPDFGVHYEEAYLRLQGSLVELIQSAGGDPARPQENARRFGIDKTLAWKVSKLMNSRDPFAAVRHIPGKPGFEILLARLAEAGASPARIEGARSARAEFDRMVEHHAGDRASLELMLRSMAPEAVRTPRLENSRKLAFQGNSAIWGVQAALQWSTRWFAPNADDPDRVDLVNLGGFRDLRRLRRTSWPLGHVRSYGVADASSTILPLDPRVGDGPVMLPDFCSLPMPEVRMLPDDGGTMYELAEGPVGNAGAVTCALGWVRRSYAPAYARAEDIVDERLAVIEHSVIVDTPVEELQFDVFFHRSLPFTEVPRATLVSLLQGRPEFPLSGQDRYRLPMQLRVQALGAEPPVVTTPELPRYRELLEFVCENVGTELKDFTGYRLKLRYPPIPSQVVLYQRQPRR